MMERGERRKQEKVIFEEIDNGFRKQGKGKCCADEISLGAS